MKGGKLHRPWRGMLTELLASAQDDILSRGQVSEETKHWKCCEAVVDILYRQWKAQAIRVTCKAHSPIGPS